jgi:hypothetical protein
VGERITVYARRPVEGSDWLEHIVRSPDYLTAAERAGLDEAVIKTAIHGLRVTAGHEISYAGAPRPIHVSHYDEREMVRTLVEEACDGLVADVRARIAPLLGSVVEVVDFELGLQQAEGVGGVIAEQLALAVAAETDGVIDFYGNEWRVVPLLSPRG